MHDYMQSPTVVILFKILTHLLGKVYSDFVEIQVLTWHAGAIQGILP